jgi:hypothetical protein
VAVGRLRRDADSRPLRSVFDIAVQAGGELADLCRRGADRDRLFAAFLAELDAPGMLTIAVIEDVHWADEATIDLLSFLGRRADGPRAGGSPGWSGPAGAWWSGCSASPSAGSSLPA